MGTRGIICRTAVRVFAEKGYDAASMDQIALEAGVAKGTVYYHFKSKSNLFSAIIENGLDALIEDVEGATLRSTDPVEQLSAIFDALIDYAQAFDDFMYLLFKEALAPGREWASDVVVYWHRFVNIIEDVVARGKSMGRIDNVDTDAITQSIVSSFSPLTDMPVSTSVDADWQEEPASAYFPKQMAALVDHNRSQWKPAYTVSENNTWLSVIVHFEIGHHLLI